MRRTGWPLLLSRIPAGAWAVVMGSGIVSVDLAVIGQVILSGVLLWFAVAVWVLLLVRLLSSASRLRQEFRAPAILGGVAGTAVLGTRFAVQGDEFLAAVLLVVAALWLAAALPPVIRHWQTPATGTSFLLSVAFQGISVLCATLAVAGRVSWLIYVAIAACAAGLACYVIIAWQFDRRELGAGAGDHWVAGGAVAISTLAAGKITLGARFWLGAFAEVTLALWCLAMIWLLVLVASELRKPRLGYDVRRWATVFPVGMFAACSFVTGQVSGLSGITAFARAWTWVALAVLVIVLTGLVRSLVLAGK